MGVIYSVYRLRVPPPRFRLLVSLTTSFSLPHTKGQCRICLYYLTPPPPAHVHLLPQISKFCGRIVTDAVCEYREGGEGCFPTNCGKHAEIIQRVSRSREFHVQSSNFLIRLPFLLFCFFFWKNKIYTIRGFVFFRNYFSKMALKFARNHGTRSCENKNNSPAPPPSFF